jgi:hypothetical protein
LEQIENDKCLEQLSNQLANKEAQLVAAKAELKRISNSLGWRLLSRYGQSSTGICCRFTGSGLSTRVTSDDTAD